MKTVLILVQRETGVAKTTTRLTKGGQETTPREQSVCRFFVLYICIENTPNLYKGPRPHHLLSSRPAFYSSSPLPGHGEEKDISGGY